ncbi:helix-turn-helix domain-containing protein [Lysinibacillus sphaericus]|uniref:Helix-turn-helix domain-containing protein n=1 Tax=Lysinibacillus sphaericus OT4b.31 TaxID=1285586 RepID=R7ZIL3_LYSSH|nr:helix-turn-helix domain-containing protein [Lysinibacillus sphaericus]EON73952.1 helix-turn-helix domain-containing protein [Lysinibacillus sphaericus OT4b.31]
MNIGEFIRKKRKEKKLTLKQLADEIGLSQTYLSQIELGDRKASPEIIKKLAKVFNLPHLYLMEKAGYTGKTDRMENLRAQLLSLQEEKMKHNIHSAQIAVGLTRSDLSEEDRKYGEKISDNTNLAIQRLNEAIKETQNYIGALEALENGLDLSRELNKNFGGFGNLEEIPIEEIKSTLEKSGYPVKVSNQSQTDLETFFNSAQEITINGKILTDEEKQKALQILKLTFDK